MTLYRNVRPLLMGTSADRDTVVAWMLSKHLKTRGIVQKGDIYAITCGEPMGAPGGTNMLKICAVQLISAARNCRGRANQGAFESPFFVCPQTLK